MATKEVLLTDTRVQYNGFDIVIAFRFNTAEESIDAFVGTINPQDSGLFDAK